MVQQQKKRKQKSKQTRKQNAYNIRAGRWGKNRETKRLLRTS